MILLFALPFQILLAYDTCENTGYIMFGDSRTDFADVNGGCPAQPVFLPRAGVRVDHVGRLVQECVLFKK